MTQIGLFEGRRLRDEGKARASGGRDWWLREARNQAVRIASNRGEVTSDDLHNYFATPPNTSQNIWGSVFSDPRFVHCGFTQSKRPEAHARTIKVWRLKFPANHVITDGVYPQDLGGAH